MAKPIRDRHSQSTLPPAQRVGFHFYLTSGETTKALKVYARIQIRFIDVELEQSLKIADEQRIYAYDAYVLRCAQKHRSPLISLDQSLLARVKKLASKSRTRFRART